MNLCRLEILAQWLENGALPAKGVDAFCMQGWQVNTQCGTTACIAGTAVAFFGSGFNGRRAYNEAKQLLDLTEEQANKLFYASGYPGISQISSKTAARVVRHLMKKGEVDWTI